MGIPNSNRSERLEKLAPLLAASTYALTSKETEDYNCIAWALGDTKQWWWPTPRYACYWPPGVNRDNTLATVRRIFEIHGYRVCENAISEIGFEKVALYEHAVFGIEHVSRQLQTGKWTSKVGELEDIQHSSPLDLEIEDYGVVRMIMKRPRKDWI